MTTLVKDDVLTLIRDEGIPHRVFNHPPCATSLESADARKNAGAGITTGAKALLLKTKKKFFFVCVIPGSKKLDSKSVRSKIGKFSFADPEEMDRVARGMKPGHMPPFGNRVFPSIDGFLIDTSILEVDDIGFNAGCPTTSVVMKGMDLYSLNNAKNSITGSFIKE